MIYMSIASITHSGSLNSTLVVLPFVQMKWLIMLRKLKNCPLKIKVVVTGILFLLMVPHFILMYYIVYKDFISPQILQMQSCGACYGVSYCPRLQEALPKGLHNDLFTDTDHMNLEGWKHVFPFLEWNHYVAHDKTTQRKVVLKRLGNSTQMRVLDSSICELSVEHKSGIKVIVGNLGTSQTLCDTNQAIQHTNFVRAAELHPAFWKQSSSLMHCPSQRFIDLIMQGYHERHQTGEWTFLDKSYLLTTMIINLEPLILQAFPAANGWPFPEYIGACGRVVVEEYIGTTLMDTVSLMSWEEKVDLAYQILLTADRLSDGDLGFALYWTSISLDDFALNQEGKITVVNLSNLVVVDRSKIHREKPDGYDTPFFRSQCPDIYSDSEAKANCIDSNKDLINKLCNRYTTDHNYYMVCKHIIAADHERSELSLGLLDDVPRDVESKWRLQTLVQKCIHQETADNSLDVKEQLMSSLRDLRRDVF